MKIGVIADDFTGAGDIGSFLQKNGSKTLLFTKIPSAFSVSADCAILALKSRSAEPEEAVRQAKEAAAFLKKAGAERIYFKYCSTFDSTPKGNIGVVLDALLEELKLSFTILCPSLPVNGRTVKDGILFVNGVPLAESPMKDHPLNPMWDSGIPELMRLQSRHPCFVLKREDMTFEKVQKRIENYRKIYRKFYLVPDYENEEDGKKIAHIFQDCYLLSGGSGLAEHLTDFAKTTYIQPLKKQTGEQKALLLCGSCSRMSGKQIAYYRQKGRAVYGIDSERLIDKSLQAEEVFAFVLAHDNVLVYTSAAEEMQKRKADTKAFFQTSKLMEKLMADLGEMAAEHGFTRFVVAGGETSGAVALRLGYHAYQIGNSIAPGVPILNPLERPELRLILKSGNFGGEDFFEKALLEE